MNPQDINTAIRAYLTYIQLLEQEVQTLRQELQKLLEEKKNEQN